LSSRRPLHSTGGKYMVRWVKEGKCRLWYITSTGLLLKKTVVYYDVI
jgi:hypothetical protein